MYTPYIREPYTHIGAGVCAQSSLLKNSVQRHKSNALSELVCET
jgi:hypothetical protein